MLAQKLAHRECLSRCATLWRCSRTESRVVCVQCWAHGDSSRGQLVTADDIGTTSRLRKQLALIVEADRLKRVLRRTVITGSSRHENSAEHSWHLALAAMTLA